MISDEELKAAKELVTAYRLSGDAAVPARVIEKLITEVEWLQNQLTLNDFQSLMKEIDRLTALNKIYSSLADKFAGEREELVEAIEPLHKIKRIVAEYSAIGRMDPQYMILDELKQALEGGK